jgi:hypothetical protein
MKLRNKLYNWFFGVKRLRSRGCHNAGTQGTLIVPYDWNKPMSYMTKTFVFKPSFKKKIYKTNL